MVGGDRPENDVLPQTEDRSTDGGNRRNLAFQDPLCLSPEDDLRPPVRERTWFRRLGETQALASLPFIGENKRGLPARRRDL